MNKKDIETEGNDQPTESDLNEALLESASESERWDPVHGSTGNKVPVPAGDDEDEEGRSNSEGLVEEGIAEAEQDQMRQAAKAQQKNE